MAETTTQKIRDYLGGLVGVEAVTIDLHRDDAKQRVIDDGVTVNDPDFERMQRFMSAHNLTLAGHFQEVSAESVGDTSRSNIVNPRTEGRTSFLEKYEERLTKKFGLGERIGVDV